MNKFFEIVISILNIMELMIPVPLSLCCAMDIYAYWKRGRLIFYDRLGLLGLSLAWVMLLCLRFDYFEVWSRGYPYNPLIKVLIGMLPEVFGFTLVLPMILKAEYGTGIP